MAKIISISRRSDIPTFYTPWLIGRLRAGYCHTFNPFGGQVYRVSLEPEDVITLSFWSRNPDLDAAIRTFQKPSDRLSPAQVRWRYDPIILSTATPIEYHFRRFEQIARSLQGYTHHCIFSFLQYYGKTGQRRCSLRIEPALFAQVTRITLLAV